MSAIERFGATRRMSQVVVYQDLIWLAGQCGTAGKSVTEQTREALNKIAVFLGQNGSDTTRILSATIWLSDIVSYDEMNAVWDGWIPEGCAPAHACSVARLGGEGYDVEISCVAAKSDSSE